VSDIVNHQVVHVATAYGLVASKSAAKALANAGGLYLNNQRVDAERMIESVDILENRLLVLRAGKDSHKIIELTDKQPMLASAQVNLFFLLNITLCLTSE